MKNIAASIAISAIAATGVDAQGERRRIAPPAVYDVAPGLGRFTDEFLFGEVWERKELAPRDRSLVTVSAIVLFRLAECHLRGRGDEEVL